MVKQKAIDLGEHFSAHVHGMILHPKATIRKIVREPIDIKDLWVPFAVVLVASVMTSIGRYIWSIAVEPSILISLGHTIYFFADLILLRPFWMIFIVWIFTSLVLHFIGSIVSGHDITDWKILHKTLKLTGVAASPAFLNILPYFFMFTGFWSYALIFWSMKENYSVSDEGAFVVTAPFLAGVVFIALIRLGLL